MRISARLLSMRSVMPRSMTNRVSAPSRGSDTMRRRNSN